MLKLSKGLEGIASRQEIIMSMTGGDEFVQPPEPASFNTLLDMNAVGIVEKIFLMLDRVSLDKCHHVCKAWSDVLSSDVFQKKKASLAKRMWMNTENLNREVWARVELCTPVRWAASGDEVAYYDMGEGGIMGSCTYFDNDGERKTCFFNSWSRGNLWILEETIVNGFRNEFHLINKRSMAWSTLSIPEPTESNDPFGSSPAEPYVHLNPALGLSIATLPIKVIDGGSAPFPRWNNFIWLGQISKDHRQESDWPTDFNRDFVTDADGLSYFARVNVGNLTVASYCQSYDCFKPAFSDDGTHFMLRGPEDESQLYVFVLDRENTRLLWRTGLTPLSEIPVLPAIGIFGSPPHVLANSRNLFILNSDGMIKVLNIIDGSEEKNLKISSNDVWFWWDKIASSEKFLLAFLPSPPPHLEWNHDDHEEQEPPHIEENALDHDLVMIKHGTFEFKTLSIRESQEEKLKVVSLPGVPSLEGPGSFGLLEDKSIAVVPKCCKEGGVYKLKICHLDLEADQVFNSRSVARSMMPFGTDVAGAPLLNEEPNFFNPAVAIPKGYIFHVGELDENENMNCFVDFHEICTGVYIIEYLVKITRQSDQPGEQPSGQSGRMMHCLEIVSWKSEELPKSLTEFLNDKFHKV